MKKALLASAVIAALALTAWLLWGSPNQPSEQAQNLPQMQAPDTAAGIQKDIESVQVNDLDQEFKAVDADINQL